MTAALDSFIEEARGVSIAEAAARLDLEFKPRGSEHPQPCPATGGVDRFSFNTAKNIWNCRYCDAGGRDAIGMAAHVLGFDVRTREGLLESCSAVLGQDIPEEGERESAGEKAARLARLEDQRRKNAARAEKREREQLDFREKERRRARGIFDGAETFLRGPVEEYLLVRGCGRIRSPYIRYAPDLPYWHGQDDRGAPVSLYSGPAMVAPFVGADGVAIGCHITWIDLGNAPKFRPTIVDPSTGEILPTKKMRGSKKGGVIPLAGDSSARRWLGGEGIENTLAFARWEGFRADTFYFAAGDLGNMAGPADPKSRFPHPTLTKPDKNGRERPVMVAGPDPLFHESGEPAAMVVPAHVDELVLLGDGDSEPVMTAAAMVRAKARHRCAGRLIPVAWPGRGTDFAAMMAGADEACETDGAPA